MGSQSQAGVLITSVCAGTLPARALGSVLPEDADRERERERAIEKWEVRRKKEEESASTPLSGKSKRDDKAC